MSETVDSKAVPVPKLAAGKIMAKIYLTWRGQLVSLAQIKRRGTGLNVNLNLPVTCIDWTQVMEADPPKKKLIKSTLKCNAAAMAYLTHMLVNNRAISCIEKAKTTEYPNGLAHLLLKRLDQKFMPKGGFTMSGLRDQLRKLKFKDKDDPNEFFEKIAGIKNLSMQLDQTDSISKDELVSHMITATPGKYMSCIKKVIYLFNGENITVGHLEKEILEWYDLHNITLGDSDDSEDKDETAMTGFTFNGKCYNCGKDGHRANNCNERKNDRANNQQGRGNQGQGRGRFTGKCCKCNKVGHKDPERWEHEKNASKRPKGYKTAASRETGMAATDDSDIEFMLCSVVKDKKEFSSKEKFQISNPNIAIADTGA